MPDKCAKKTCPPHADGRTRACNPETGRCKLVKPKPTAKTSVKPKPNGTQPMTQKEIVAYLESSGAYSELDNFRETHANLLDDGHGTGFSKVLIKWMIKHGATRVTQQLLKKLLPAPGKKVKLVVFNWGDEDYSSAYYEKAQGRSFDDLVATRLKKTDDAEEAISEAARWSEWNDEWSTNGYDGPSLVQYHHSVKRNSVKRTRKSTITRTATKNHPAHKGPASDLVQILYASPVSGLDFYSLVWLNPNAVDVGTYSSGRYNMMLTWLK